MDSAAFKSRLIIGHKTTKLTADYAVRFVQQSDGVSVLPVVYHRGKRVTQRVLLDFKADIPADPEGESANTA